jgi:predicted porin
VGIESAKFGTISLGRQNDSIKDLEGLGQVYNLSDNLHINTLVGDRYASIYKYSTPVINGFKASYSYSNNAVPNTDVTTDGTKTLNTFAVTYKFQNFDFGFGQGAIQAAATDDEKTSFLGVRGTFGNLSVGGHYSINEQGAKELKQIMISANYRVDSNIELKGHFVQNAASGANGVDVIGSQHATSNGQNDGSGYGLMGVYNFSKRTAAFIGYASFDATDITVSGNTSTIGLVHKF